MENDFDLVYSNDALLSRVIFLASKTELNIFVEDTNKEYEYEEIIERLLSEDLKINCIFPTGGKPYLKEAYYLFGKSEDYGKCFFIADGDFDKILNIEMIVADNFIYLERYNIESYLLHKKTVLKYMRPKLKRQLCEVGKIINYDNWLNEVSVFFKKVFALHCLVQKYGLDITNVSRGAGYFIQKNGYPNTKAFEKYIKEIAPFIPNIDTQMNQMILDLETTYGEDARCFVCGKYFIYSLTLLLNTKIKRGFNSDDLKAELIHGFDISALKYISEKLYTYLNN